MWLHCATNLNGSANKTSNTIVPQEFHFSVNAKSKIVNALHQETGLTKTTIKHAMQQGAVWCENQNGIHRVRRADKILSSNDTIHFYYNHAILNLKPPPATLIKDEIDYSVWRKPRGMLSQGSKWSDHCTIQRWIETHYRFNNTEKRPCYSVHRLDQDTEGLMFIAHKKKTATQLAHLFEQRQINKHYYAIVTGEFPNSFNQSEGETKPIQIERAIDNKYAKTWLKRIDYNQHTHQSLLDIQIETGRKHQIRIHCADYGFPIVGDKRYGIADATLPMQLQCYQLGILSNTHIAARSYQTPLALSW